MTTARSESPIPYTIHPLPFDRLSPLDFERLCLWLVEREGYTRGQHLGLAGSEQGRGVVAYKPTPHGEELWYFSVKRYRSTSAKVLKDEVDKYLHLAQEKPHLRPVGVVFVMSCAVSARVREEVGDYCEQHGLAYEFWALTELDMRVRQHPEIVREFFGLARADRFQPTVPPMVTVTAHVLPFDRLSPVDFERLCLWLVEREGYTRGQHLGLAGSEQGRDVVAYKPTPHGEELWYFQVKRYRSTSAKVLKDEVDKCLHLAQEKPHLRPVGVVFVMSCAVSARVREEVGDYCEQHGLAYEFWALTELDMRVKQHLEIVREFFGLARADLFQPTIPRTATTHVLPLEEMSFQDLRGLCLKLFRKEGYRFLQVQPIDAAGEIDLYLIAYKERNQAESETWIFEWSEQKLADVSSFTAKVKEIQLLGNTYPLLGRISGVHFIRGGMIPAPIRTEVQDDCSDIGTKIRFWGLTELDELAKRYPDIVKEYFDQPSPAKHLDVGSEPAALSHLLTLCLDRSLSAYDKGKALEDLAAALFEPCFEIINNVRTETGEIDLVLTRRDTTSLFWTDYGVIAMAECKNRSEDNPVKSFEVVVLIGKCEQANVKLGFFVSLGPFTRDALERISRENEKHAHSPLIVPVRREDIESLIRSKEEPEIWLRGLVMPARLGQKEFYSYGFRRRGTVTKKS